MVCFVLPHPGIAGKLVQRMLKFANRSLPARPEDLLNDIFQKVFLEPSASKGLLGDVACLAVSGACNYGPGRVQVWQHE